MDILDKKDVPLDTIVNLMMIFGYTANLVPRMALKEYLPKVLEKGINYVK